MSQFYTFPCSCAVQVLGGFNDGGNLPTESLELKHRLTIAVLASYQNASEPALKKLGFIKLGTFNAAHISQGRLSLWVAGGGFKPEPQAPEKEKEDGNKNTKDSRGK